MVCTACILNVTYKSLASLVDWAYCLGLLVLRIASQSFLVDPLR